MGLLGVLCCLASPVHAHAPQARSVALTPGAAGIAIALPGFGLLLRPQPEQPFSYACDALLMQQPSDVPAALAFLPDGSLLLGTMGGVRLLSPEGCPRSTAPSDLSGTAVIALAAHPGPLAVAYAASAGTKAGLWRSSDGGASWELRAPLSDAALVTALRIDSDDAQRIYMSRGTAAGHSTLLVSGDGGATFTSFDQDRGLTLLATPRGSAGSFWALARDPAFTGQRGFDLLRADTLAGPWTNALQLNYFGGFAIDGKGVVWVGDEGGGVYRSDDGGLSFTKPDPESAVACLAYAGDALWACAPGGNRQPALVTRSDAQPAFAKVVAFADVDRMVDCGPDIDVGKRCAAAWIEWQRDVLQRDLTAHDAGVTSGLDAGIGPGAGDAEVADDAARRAVPVLDAETDGPPSTAASAARHGGCSLPGPVPRDGPGALLWLALTALLISARAAHARRARALHGLSVTSNAATL